MQATEGDVKATAWTLRFKNGKYTIVLLAEPLTPFTSLKTELLATLRERYPAGLSFSTSTEPLPIPDSIHEVLLGVPVDTYEPSKGWVEIATDWNIKESPKSLGLKDGSMIAFTFIEGEEGEETAEFHVEFSSYEDQYPEDMVDDAA